MNVARETLTSTGPASRRPLADRTVPLLEVKDLSVTFGRRGQRPVPAGR